MFFFFLKLNSCIDSLNRDFPSWYYLFSHLSSTFLQILLVSHVISHLFEDLFLNLETFPLLCSFLILESFNYLVVIISKFYLILASKLITFFLMGY